MSHSLPVKSRKGVTHDALIHFCHTPTLFMMSCTPTTSHKMAALVTVFSWLSNIEKVLWGVFVLLFPHRWDFSGYSRISGFRYLSEKAMKMAWDAVWMWILTFQDSGLNSYQFTLFGTVVEPCETCPGKYRFTAHWSSSYILHMKLKEVDCPF